MSIVSLIGSVVLVAATSMNASAPTWRVTCEEPLDLVGGVALLGV